MTIIIVQSKSTGHWNYCPKAAYESFFRLAMDYDEDSDFLTAQDALQAAQADQSIPEHTHFEVQS